MKKRWFAILLALAMCLSLLPITAAAEAGEEEEEASLWLCKLEENSSRVLELTDTFYQSARYRVGSSRFVVAFYGTETQVFSGEGTMIAPGELTFTSNLSYTTDFDDPVASDIDGYAFCLQADQISGESYLSYQGSKVLIKTPVDVAMYSDISFSDESRNNNYGYTGNEGTQLTLYIKAEDGWTITDIGGGFPPCLDFSLPTGEVYAVMTVDLTHETFAFNRDYDLVITLKNAENLVISTDLGICIEDWRDGAPTGFYDSLSAENGALGDGKPGEARQAYFIWRDVGAVETFTADLWVQKENDVLEEAALSDPDTIAILEEYGFILDIQNTYIKVNTTVGRDKKLTLSARGPLGRESASYDVGLIWNSWGDGDDIPQVEIDGVEYTFGLAEIDEDADTLSILSPGDGFGGWDPFLGIIENYDTSDAQPAAPAIYGMVQNLKFEIVDYYNTTGPASPCNVSLGETMTATWNGRELSGIVINDDSPDGAEVKLKTSFSVDGEDFSIINVISHGAKDTITHFTLDAGSRDTAEKLNELLSSKDSFLTWVQAQDRKNGTNIYREYQMAYALGMAETIDFTLKLPAVVYDDIITVNTRGLDLTLQGTEDENGNRTTMPGLRILRNRYPVYVEDIDFVAVEALTHGTKYPFTCGVLAARAGDINASGAGKARISGCTFTGFDYGVRGMSDSAATLNGPCQFFNCKVGYQLEGDPGNHARVRNCIFVKCGTAIRILKMPQDFAPYNYRIFECDFLSCGTDLDVQAKGRFYFHRNYFGEVNPNQTPDQWDSWSFRSRTVVLNSGKETQIVTNPCRVNPYNVGGINDNTLYIDTTPGLLTYVPNKEANSLKVNTDSLKESDQTVTINVTNDTDTVQATWTIN